MILQKSKARRNERNIKVNFQVLLLGYEDFFHFIILLISQILIFKSIHILRALLFACFTVLQEDEVHGLKHAEHKICQ